MVITLSVNCEEGLLKTENEEKAGEGGRVVQRFGLSPKVTRKGLVRNSSIFNL